MDEDPDVRRVGPFEVELALQSPGRPSMIRALGKLDGPTTRMRGAFAYVTGGGVAKMEKALHECARGSVSKEWLFSFDFGLTEPRALRHLLTRPGTEIRIPAAEQALDNPFARARGKFHPKLVWITRMRGLHDIFLGSANLTESGLSSNWEAGVSLRGISDAGNEPLLLSLRGWWTREWEASEPCTARLVDRYERARRRIHEILPVTAILDRSRDNVDLVRAHLLWTQVGPTMGGSGNQMQLPMMCSPFFSRRMPVFVQGNRSLITLRYQGRRYPDRSVHGQPNGMIRVNLPTSFGAIPHLPEHFVVFERRAPRLFDLTLVPPNRVRRVVAPLRVRSLERGQTAVMPFGGRTFGWL